jgi:hypothetical protein
LRELAEAVGQTPAQLDRERFIGLVIHDGLGVAEETTMGTLSSLTNLPFVGGSAGDELDFQRTWQFANGEALTGRCVLALLETRQPVEVLKSQTFDTMDEVLEVTEVDKSIRTVHAFNGRPAVQAYADALGVPASELSKYLRQHPLGLDVGSGDLFVRSPLQLRGDSIAFYCQVEPGMRLHLLRGRDIVADTGRDLTRTLERMGPCAGIINFHCVLRTLELEEKQQTEAYGQLFRDVPTIGFSTYGESYIGHINQTSTMVLFRR